MLNQLLAGRYRITQELSSGGFATTYLAEDSHRPGLPQCVVKQLRPPTNDPYTLQNARRLFQTEGEILERLGREHDQIPQLFAYFEENGEFYLIEEFISGHPLTLEMQPDRPLPEDQVIRLMEDILEILVFVHGKGVIHRDIKPANLIRRQQDNKLVLIDFGLVKEIANQVLNSQGQANPTVAVGTHGYMPIEQFHGYPRYNSDIYALGMLAIQAIAGLSANDLLRLRDPNNPNTGEILWRNRIQLRPKLADIIDRMVRYDCRQRYQSAAEVLTELRKIDSHSINIANYWSRLRRLPRRLVFASSASVMVVTLTIIFYFQLPQALAAAYFYNRGIAKNDRQNYKDAIKDFNEAIRIKPKYAEAYSKRCHAYLMLGDRQQAMQDCTHALQIKSNFTQAYEAYNNRGMVRLALGDAQGAIADYTQGIQMNPKFAIAYNNRGTVRNSLGDKKGAIEDFTQAIKFDAKFATAYLNRCLARSNAGDHKAAVDDCSKAIAINPNLVQAYLNRSLVNSRLKNYKKAIDDSNVAIRINPDRNSPDLGEAYHNRGTARRLLGDRQGALDDLNHAIRINSQDAGAFYERGLVRADLGDRQKAIEDFLQAAKLRLEQGSTQGYKDAKYQITRLQEQNPPPDGDAAQ